jgi:cytochrome c oxidase assembly protein subunit 15
MHDRLQRFAWWVLGYNVAVVLWGAYVRATGSGAGCGSHWPLCNGDVVPRGAGAATLIEFSHRLTSGLALLGVLALVIWVWRACGRGHRARRGALWSLLLILVEAGIGAGLVLFELVADNASMARALFMAAHLVNTFFLLAALTLTAVWIADPAPMRFRRRPRVTLAVVVCVVWLIGAGMSAPSPHSAIRYTRRPRWRTPCGRTCRRPPISCSGCACCTLRSRLAPVCS